jgi:hypothetical protein
MNTSPLLAPDAAIALGIASTALPFAGDQHAASECWLRILRLHGDAGVALQSLGVGEDVIETPTANVDDQDLAASDGHDLAASDSPTIAEVADEAARIASARGADGIATTDLLLAVIEAYGLDFERALEAHGTDRAEVRERLCAQLAS